MEFTKEQRHEIYKKALDLYSHMRERKFSGSQKGLPAYLSVCLMVVSKSSTGSNNSMFPEFLSIDPLLDEYNDSEQAHQKRVELMEKCIEETKQRQTDCENKNSVTNQNNT